MEEFLLFVHLAGMIIYRPVTKFTYQYFSFYFHIYDPTGLMDQNIMTCICKRT